jgi:hypothetical protein
VSVARDVLRRDSRSTTIARTALQPAISKIALQATMALKTAWFAHNPDAPASGVRIRSLDEYPGLT